MHDHHRIFCPGEVGHNLRSHKYTRCSMVVAMRFCIVSGSPLGQICMSLSLFALLWKISCDIFDSNFQIRSCWDKWCLDFLSHPTDNICQRVQGPACRWAAQIPLQWCWFFPSNHWRDSQSHEKCHWAWIYDIVDMGPLVHRTAYSQISKIYHIYQNPLVAKKRSKKIIRLYNGP